MSDQKGRLAFAQAVLNEPADDLPRLVFADYLEDTANPPDPERAEFIRIQVELDRKPAMDRAERAKLTARAQNLLAKNAMRFLPRCIRPPSRALWRISDHVPGAVFIDSPAHAITPDYPYLGWVTFRRGFIAAVHGEWPRSDTDERQYAAYADHRFAATVRRLCNSQPIQGVGWSFYGSSRMLTFDPIPLLKVDGKTRFRVEVRYTHAGASPEEELPIYPEQTWTWEEMGRKGSEFERLIRIHIAAAEVQALEEMLTETEYEGGEMNEALGTLFDEMDEPAFTDAALREMGRAGAPEDTGPLEGATITAPPPGAGWADRMLWPQSPPVDPPEPPPGDDRP